MPNDEQQSTPQVPTVAPSVESVTTLIEQTVAVPQTEPVVTAEPLTQRVDSLLGQPTATNLEERPVTALPHDDAVTLPMAQSFIASPKRNRALPIAIGSIVAVLVVAAGAFWMYYNLVRLQDSAYQAAAAPIDAMVADVGKTQIIWKLSPTTTTTASVMTTAATDSSIWTPEGISNMRKVITDYSDKLDQLEALTVVQKDSKVQAAFAASQKTFTAYYTQATDTVDSIDVLLTFVNKYQALDDKISTYKTTQDFNKGAADVREYAKEHPTVPLKDFSDTFYVPYRQDALDVLSLAGDAFDAAQAKDQAKAAAVVDGLTKVMKKLADLADKLDSYKPAKPTSPTSQLNDLKQTINNRKAVFLR
jgi:hypothetical protein